jgi:carboxylesterase type B
MLAKSLKAPIVETKYGAIEGFNELNSFNYLGIPFAQAPVNELRWINPQVAKPWSPNVLNATQFQSSCPQNLNCDQNSVCPTTVYLSNI